MAYVISDACVKCGACADACPLGIITEGDDKYVIDADQCVEWRHLRCRVPERCDQRGIIPYMGTTARARCTGRYFVKFGYTPVLTAFKHFQIWRDEMREYFSGGITMTVTDGCFRLSTDSMVLADFCRLPRGAAVCDLGSGCGALGLLLLRDHPDMRVTGLEILPDAAAQARKNIDANHLSEHFSVITGDLRGHRTLLPASAFDAVVSNPPYFPAASGAISPDDARAIARSEVCCTIDDLCACAAYALRFGGEFFLVHKPERLTDLLCTLRAHRLEPKRIRLVRHHAGADANLVLIAARRGGKPGVMLEPELLLFTPDGQETTDYRRIYHHQED